MSKRTNNLAILIFSISLPAAAQTTGWTELSTNKVKLDTARAFNVFVADINNDRYPDMLTIKGGWGVGVSNAMKAYINVRDTASGNPDARMFVDVTETSGVNGMPGTGGTSKGVLVAALADVNNDGNIDLVRGNYYHADPAAAPDDRTELLLGDGQGGFKVFPNSGLHELGVINVTAMSFLDYDKDGNIDLFIGRWFDNYGQNSNIWSPGILMKGNGDGTFTDVSVQAGITEPEPMYGTSVVDWNNDGWPDIATAPYCRTNGQLWKNNGDGTFTNVAAQAGYNARYMNGAGQGMCMWSAVPEDYDNDGDMDFFFSLVHGGSGASQGRSAVVLNGGAENGYKLTVDRSLITRINPQSSHHGDYDGSWFDLDNDGLMDLLLAQGHYMPATDRLYVFRQDASHHLMDITGDLGLIRTEMSDLHLLEAMDYDLDGDDDIMLCRNGQPRGLHLIENRIGQDNNWTGIFLRTPEGVNKSGIGTRIYVWSGGVKRMREVYAGRGNNGGQQPFALLFGLGSHTRIDSVMVQWPDKEGSRTIVRNPPVNTYLEITSKGLEVKGNKEKQQPVLKVYPNPAKDFILIQTAGAKPSARIVIYDMLGHRMMDASATGGNDETWYCSIRDLSAGQYIVRLETEDGNTASRSFVKGE